jgi:uncharacterized membrane protein
MEFVLLVAILVVALVRWAITSSRLKRLDQRTYRLERSDAEANAIAALTRRVYELEKEMSALRSAANEAAATAPPEPQPAAEPAPMPEVQPEAAPPLVSEVPTVEPPAEEPVPSAQLPAFTAPAPRENWRDRIRRRVAGRDWEAVVGGNWLNKLGVLILIIGIAFGVGYSFTRVGPAGRVAISFAVSLAMLVAGVMAERKAPYRIFARGLIGGGWAGVYFTTYAMHAIAGAKLIDNAWLASALLTLVALGMIVHSLKYQSQTVTGLAYFITFATLTITPVTTFAVLALLPLAASLLYLAYRFQWFRMALFGLLATYGTCASRGDAGAPLWSVQALVASYWLLFEIFGLLRARRPGDYSLTEKLIYPLNTIGLFALSFPKWETAAHARLYEFFALLAILHFVDSILRAWLRPPASLAAATRVWPRAFSGGYEAGAAFASLFCAIALPLRFAGVNADYGLLLEGEILVGLGLYFRQSYLRLLAGGVFAAELARIASYDLLKGAPLQIGSLHLMPWTPVAVLTALVFYANRRLEKLKNPYTYAAAGLVALVLGFEMNAYYVGVAWIVFALANFELGLRTRLREFRFQAYAIGAAGAVAVAVESFFASEWRDAWAPIAVAAVANYAVALRVLRPEWLRKAEAKALSMITSAAATIFFAALLWKTTPHGYAGFGWLALAMALFELGIRGWPAYMRANAYVLGALGILRLLASDVIEIHKTAGLAQRISLAGAAILCYLAVGRALNVAALGPRERTRLRDFVSLAGTVFLTTVLWVVLADPVVAVAWMVAALCLIEIGFAAHSASFRVQGDALHVLVFARLFLANFTNQGSTFGISHRLLTIAPIAIAEYYLWWRHRRSATDRRERSIGRVYLYAAAVLIVLLLRFELGHVLTVVGWIGFAIALYFFGSRNAIADLRLQTYAIAALVFWRSWTTNFYAPESLAGMHGRIVTGAIVILGFYALQLMAPRGARARIVFSLLGSALLAVLLDYEVSGGMLTVAWGIEAVALLVAGFPLRDRILRLSGLALFLVCIVKLFAYDLRNLETVNRILSFVILGAVMVGVSWVYTRFRGRIQRLL